MKETEDRRGPPLPTVHRNGTSANVLFEQALRVMDAARELSEALVDAWPHGRDYYPQGPTAIREAEEYWRQAQVDVARIKDDAEAMALDLSSKKWTEGVLAEIRSRKSQEKTALPPIHVADGSGGNP